MRSRIRPLSLSAAREVEAGAKTLEVVSTHPTRKGQSLRVGTIVETTIINASGSTRSADNACDPKMHQARKSDLWCFGMKPHLR